MTTRPICFPDPVPDRANLFDRDPALTDVLESLRHCTTVVRGGRLIGKTSLLNVVAQSAEEQGQFAMIRLAPTDSRATFMAEILDGVRQWVEGHGRDSGRTPAPVRARAWASNRRPNALPRPRIAPEQPVGTVAQFCQRIAALAERAPDVVFLLCVDEFDSLIKHWDEREARLVMELMEHLDTMPNLPIRFLLTMSTIPDLLLNSFRSPILNQSRIVALEPWDADDAARFVEWLSDDRFVFDEAAHAALFAAAGGHPYFTKAVLNSLLTELTHPPGSRYVTVQQIASAVQQVVRSLEVDLALTNLVGVHLSAEAATILDRAGSSHTGVTARNLGPTGSGLLSNLRADGLLRQQDDRYLLRLGLWREWRAATSSASVRPPRLRHLGRVARRLSRQRTTSYILLSALAGPLLSVLVATALLAQQRTIRLRPCGAAAANLAVNVTYPAFASAGDEQEIHIRVANNGRTELNGSALLSFSAGQARWESGNAVQFNGLRSGEEFPRDLDFTVPAGLLAPSGSRIGVTLAVSAPTACPKYRWSITVAPIAHLRLIQKVAGAVLVIFLIPLVVNYVSAFLHEKRSSRASAGAPGSS
jgi:hypothetical protein